MSTTCTIDGPLVLDHGDDETPAIGPITDDAGAFVNLTGFTGQLVLTSHRLATEASGTTYAATITGNMTLGFTLNFAIPRADIPVPRVGYFLARIISAADKRQTVAKGKLLVT